MQIKVNGEYALATPFIKVNGVYKQATAFVKHLGIYQSCILADAPQYTQVQPVVVTEALGAIATFGTDVTYSGTGTVYYQWEFYVDIAGGWIPLSDVSNHISGATTNTVTNHALDPDDNGILLRCVITADNHTVITNSASLTILPGTYSLRYSTTDIDSNQDGFVDDWEEDYLRQNLSTNGVTVVNQLNGYDVATGDGTNHMTSDAVVQLTTPSTTHVVAKFDALDGGFLFDANQSATKAYRIGSDLSGNFVLGKDGYEITTPGDVDWHVITMIMDDDSTTILIDGSFVASNTDPASADLFDTLTLFADSAGANLAMGRIAEIVINPDIDLVTQRAEAIAGAVKYGLLNRGIVKFTAEPVANPTSDLQFDGFTFDIGEGKTATATVWNVNNLVIAVDDGAIIPIKSMDIKLNTESGIFDELSAPDVPNDQWIPFDSADKAVLWADMLAGMALAGETWDTYEHKTSLIMEDIIDPLGLMYETGLSGTTDMGDYNG